MALQKVIIRENGKIKAKVTVDGKYDDLVTMTNGWQWSGVGMNPELARLTIEVLQEYLEDAAKAL